MKDEGSNLLVAFSFHLYFRKVIKSMDRNKL